MQHRLPSSTFSILLLLAVLGSACSTQPRASEKVCMVGAEWRAAAQEWLFVSNEQGVSPAQRQANLQAAFVPLGNVLLPPVEQYPKSLLLPAMQQWRSEVERWMSTQGPTRLPALNTAGESERLQMNSTVQKANPLLKSECNLEPMLLYQQRPKSN